MTAFFALLFGILLGLIAGVAFTCAVVLSSHSLREYFEKEAFDSHVTYENTNEEL